MNDGSGGRHTSRVVRGHVRLLKSISLEKKKSVILSEMSRRRTTTLQKLNNDSAKSMGGIVSAFPWTVDRTADRGRTGRPRPKNNRK